MEIKIEGNPGTGNTFQKIDIGKVDNYYDKVDQIVNNFYGKQAPYQAADTSVDKAALRKDILDYVYRTHGFVMYPWKKNYLVLWSDILDLPEVDVMIYDPGRQVGTVFNRKEVMHILCYLGQKAFDGMGIFEKYNATKIAAALNDGAETTTRPELGYMPDPSIRKAIDDLLQKKNYMTES